MILYEGEALRGSPRGEKAQSHRIIIADDRRSLKRYFTILDGAGFRLIDFSHKVDIFSGRTCPAGRIVI